MTKAQIRFALRMMKYGETATIKGKAVRKWQITTPRAHAGPVTADRYSVAQASFMTIDWPSQWYGDTATTVDKLSA